MSFITINESIVLCLSDIDDYRLMILIYDLIDINNECQLSCKFSVYKSINQSISQPVNITYD